MTQPRKATPDDLARFEQTVRAIAADSFQCPRCGMTSYNPNDKKEGYCGNCHDWTDPPQK